MRPSLKANIILRGKIQCLTGLHIGGSKDKLEIGGVDAPVLRNPMTLEPYIPGSSLKGRMRALLEYSLGVINIEPEKIGQVSDDQAIVSLFGKGAGDEDPKGEDYQKLIKNHPGPTPLIIRDAMPDEYTRNFWSQMDTELLFTEYKPENTINRLTSAANPRFLERVVPDSRFDIEIVYSVYDLGRVKSSENTQNASETDANQTDIDSSPSYIERVNRDLKHLLRGLRLVEDHALGKSGSRGYGQVKFLFMEPLTIYVDDYETGGGDYARSKEPLPPYDHLKELHQIPSLTFTEKADEAAE